MKHSKEGTSQAGVPIAAIVLGIILFLTVCGSLLGIGYITQNALPGESGAANGAKYYADIHQNGSLLQTIPLSQEQEAYSFVITGEKGCTNEITVSGSQIGITKASCPDKLCIHQGFISTSRLPITCLPNRLVIQVRPEAITDIDTVTY